MLLTISNSTAPARDIGFLLHKNPDNGPDGASSRSATRTSSTRRRPTNGARRRCSSRSTRSRWFGAGGGRAMFALVRIRERPALCRVLVHERRDREGLRNGAAGRGEEQTRARGLARSPLESGSRCVPCRGGEAILRRLFEPLGYDVAGRRRSRWTRPSRPGARADTSTSRLAATARLQDVLGHLYVLLPVLDDDKHYWVASDEIDKLLRRGSDWLAGHPEASLIARRYLVTSVGSRGRRSPGSSRRIRSTRTTVEAHRAEEAPIERPGEPARPTASPRSSPSSGRPAPGASSTSVRRGQAPARAARGTSSTRSSASTCRPALWALRTAACGSTRWRREQRERLAPDPGSLTYRDRRLAGFDVGGR